MTNIGAYEGPARPSSPERPARSGRVPPLADSWCPRAETAPGLAGLPPGQAFVLVTGGDGAVRSLGGTGKTHLAAALAREHLDRRAADLVVWITATGRDAIVGGYAQAWHDAGGSGPQEEPERAAAQFLGWLAQTDRPWLLVLDDLSDPAVIEGYWPRGPAGRVLITTEMRDGGQLPDARVVPVGPFSNREALWYLSERLHGDHEQRTGAPDLAIELGFLPIALGQAAAVMTETRIDCRQYRALVAERRAQLLPGSVDHAATLAATWSLSVELADKFPPAGMAGRALAMISMLGPHGIPGALFTSQAARAYLAGAERAADEAHVRAAVYSLARAGLVTIDAGDAARTVRAHALVQAISRQNLPAVERDRAAVAAADAVHETWSNWDVPAEVAQALRDAVAKLREVSGAVLWAPECHPALVRSGQSLDSSGLSGAAAAYWQALVEASERQLGAAHASTVQLRNLLGAAFAASGRSGEVVAMYQDVLTDLESSAEASLPATLAERANLARAYRAAGRSGDAIELAEQTVAECERLLGPDHPDSLTAQGNLAESYVAAKRFKEAIGLRQRALGTWERLQGPDHVGTVTARVGLAGAYRAAGKHKDAIKHYQRALADRERVQGPDQPDTITTRRELAFSYMLAGRLAYSVAEYERALADCQRMLGPDDPLTRETQEDLDAAAAYAVSKVGIDLRATKPRHT